MTKQVTEWYVFLERVLGKNFHFFIFIPLIVYYFKFLKGIDKNKENFN